MAKLRVNYRLLNRVRKLVWSIFRFLLLLGLCFILLYPVLYMLSTAFRPISQLKDPSIVWIPKSLTLDNVKAAIEAMDYFEGLKNTLKVGVVSAILQTISCAVVGYGFARYKFRERNLLFALVLFTIIVPPQTIIIPSYMNFRFFNFFGLEFNLLNTPWTFYLPSIFGTGLRSGLYIYIYRQFFRGMPEELESAAKIDGCGPFQTFWRVMAPNAKPVFLTVFLFSVVWHWNDYYLSVMYFNNDLPLSVALTQLRSGLELMGLGRGWSDPSVIRAYLQAGSLLTIFPLLVLYTLAQRYFTESLERTGIVG